MAKAIIEDTIGKIDLPPEDLTTKMIKLVRTTVKEVSSKFTEGELEIYGHLNEKRVGVLYNPPKTNWYHKIFSPTSRMFISFKNEGIKEIFVTINSDPKYINKKLVSEVKEIITKQAVKLNIKIKFN